MLNQSNDVCSNCIQEVETTTHLFYDCQIAQQIFREIIRVVNDTRLRLGDRGPPLILSRDLILFNYVNIQTNLDIRNEVECLIMICKHAIVKIKYRENTNWIPTKRFSLLLICLDIEKYSQVLTNKMYDSIFTRMMIQDLNSCVGR